jgi:hypothetical protein
MLAARGLPVLVVGNVEVVAVGMDGHRILVRQRVRIVKHEIVIDSKEQARYKGRMAQNSAKKVDEEPVLYMRLTPETVEYLDECVQELNRKNPTQRHTRQDAVRAMLGAAILKRNEKRA